MPPGPQPQGARALTGAERQARYRARHAGAPAIRYRRPFDRRSRRQRWHDAVAELLALREEYGSWLEACPRLPATAPLARPCKPLSSSISARSLPSSRHAGSVAIRSAMTDTRPSPRPRTPAGRPRGSTGTSRAALRQPRGSAPLRAGPSYGLHGRPVPTAINCPHFRVTAEGCTPTEQGIKWAAAGN